MMIIYCDTCEKKIEHDKITVFGVEPYEQLHFCSRECFQRYFFVTDPKTKEIVGVP